jgi:hypothetical protein
MRLGRFASGLLALFAGAFLPIAAFYELLAEPRPFPVGPAWSLATICIVPLAGLFLLLSPGAKVIKVARFAAAFLALHAATMIALLTTNTWGAAAGYSLFIDIFLALVLVRPLCGEKPGRIARSTLFWTTVFFGLGVPLALANGFLVMWRAEAIAGERPYCIAYASQTGPFEYEAAETLFDLSMMQMRTRWMTGGSEFFLAQDHGLLLIPGGDSGRAFNWSYHAEDFIDEVINRQIKGPSKSYEQFGTPCNPRAHYARNLPLWSPSRSPYEIAIGAHHFAIPPEYRPVGNREGFGITAVAPDFAPYDRSTWHRLPAEFYSYIVIRDASDAALQSAFEKRRDEPHSVAESAGSEFGLAKTVVTIQPRPVGKLALYTGYDADGQLSRYLDCVPQTSFDHRTPTCRYNFIVNGLSVSLRIADASQWRTAEERLTELLRSWETKEGIQGP